MRSIQKLVIVLFCVCVMFASVEVLANQDAPLSERMTKIRSVAILPFADYSHQEYFIDPLRWNGKDRVIEQISRIFSKNDIDVVSQDKVNNILQTKGIIKKMLYTRKYGTYEYELLHNKLDPALEKILFQRIKKRQEATKPMTLGMVRSIGKGLGVDTIIRGAILHYYIRPMVKDPFESVLPMIYYENGTREVGYALAENYDYGINSLNALLRKHDFDMILPIGEKDASSIIILIYAQDTASGDIFWKGWFEIPYPEKEFNENMDIYLTKVLEKSIKTKPNKGYVNVSK